MPAKTEKKNESKPVTKPVKKTVKVQKEQVKEVVQEVAPVQEVVPVQEVAPVQEVVQEVVQVQEDNGEVEKPVVKKTRSSKKVKDEKSGPKKNKSSYMFFCVEERDTIKQEKSELNNKQIVVELGARWKILKESDHERLKYYEKLASEDKERYAQEKQTVSSDSSLVEEDNSKSKTKKTKKKSDDVSESKPDEQKKTKVNGYINFCRENREKVKKDNPTILPKEITKELSVLWKNLSDSEKEEYKNK